jgi:hypothetical protein
MKMGIGIGWPNASAQAGNPTVYTINLYECNPGPAFVTYSLSSTFAVGIYLYVDAALTIPVIGIAGPVIGGTQYQITAGLVTSQTYTCPL